MNFNLFLIISIALIIILLILYNGIRVLLTVEKEKGIIEYLLKVTILKIPIFKREGVKEILGSAEDDESEGQNENLEESKKGSESEGDSTEEESSEEEKEGEKGLIKKYEEIKPILKELIKSKEELKGFIINLLKAINLKKLEGKLIIGLSDHRATVKIASWIWSIGAIVNSKEANLLTVEPRFDDVIVDFEGKIELKINLLLILIYSLLLLTKKNIRNLIREFFK